MAECSDTLRTKCYQAGASDRHIHNTDSPFQWDEWQNHLQHGSLFESYRLTELHVTKPINAQGRTVLSAYMHNPAPQCTLLIIGNALTKAEKNAAWFKAAQECAGIIIPTPIHLSKLPAWIIQRGKTLGISFQHEAAQYLAEITEGNLVATAQALDQLALSADSATPMTLHDITAHQSAQYTVWQLLDAAISGNRPRTIRILRQIAHERSPIEVLGLIAYQIRQMEKVMRYDEQGLSVAAISAHEKNMWRDKIIALQKIGQCHSRHSVYQLLQRAQSIDEMIKTTTISPWRAIERLCINWARRTPT